LSNSLVQKAELGLYIHQGNPSSPAYLTAALLHLGSLATSHRD